MESTASEYSGFVLVDQCRCCFQENSNLIDLWLDHEIDGEIQNYGTMLIHCFGLNGPQWAVHQEGSVQICPECLDQLKSAHHFKETILNTDRTLLQILAQNNVTLTNTREVIKEENIETEEPQIIEIQNEKATEDTSATAMENTKTRVISSNDTYVEVIQEEVEEYEFSDREEGSSEKEEETKDDINILKEEDEVEYLDEDMLDIETAVPVTRTPVKRLKRPAKEAPTSNADHMKLCDELRTILSLTNATPFKSKVGQIHCAYCLERFPPSEARQLRAHCIVNHADTRVTGVNNFMRPWWLNEITKLDIESLHCTACYTVKLSWNEMLEHLKETHHADLELAYSKIIPFQLEDDLKCALCSQYFPSFSALDYHMNAHYSNYICGKCGDTFLTTQRLTKHLNIHETGKFPCKLCPKTFAQDKYRKKHVNIVHEKQPMYRCVDCNEKFHKAKDLKTHIDEKHGHKSKKYNCVECNKVFDLKSYYLKHLRFKHSVRERKFLCKFCDKKFHHPYELKNHIKWHSDDDNLFCKYCNVKKCNISYLQKHMERVHSHKSDVVNVVVLK